MGFLSASKLKEVMEEGPREESGVREEAHDDLDLNDQDEVASESEHCEQSCQKVIFLCQKHIFLPKRVGTWNVSCGAAGRLNTASRGEPSSGSSTFLLQVIISIFEPSRGD